MKDGEAKSALTPEEWAKREWVRQGGQPLTVSATGGAGVDMLEIGAEAGQPDYILFNEERRPLAALALHGQPFGFTWADLATIDNALGVSWNAYGSERLRDQEVGHLRSLRDRLAALLPPREP